jgi:hypothetical protein
MRVMVTNDRSAFAVSMTATGSGDSWAKSFPTAASQALAARETRSRNPMPTTMVKDQKRSLMAAITPRPGLVVTPQMVFSGVLQLPEDAPEAKQERENAKAGGEEAAAGAAGTIDGGLNRLGPGEAGEVLDLLDYLALRRLLPEQERGEGDDDDQRGGQREDGVERERRAKPRRPVLVPLVDRLTEHRPDDARRETRRQRQVGARHKSTRHRTGTDTPGSPAQAGSAAGRSCRRARVRPSLTARSPDLEPEAAGPRRVGNVVRHEPANAEHLHSRQVQTIE